MYPLTGELDIGSHFVVLLPLESALPDKSASMEPLVAFYGPLGWMPLRTVGDGNCAADCMGMALCRPRLPSVWRQIRHDIGDAQEAHASDIRWQKAFGRAGEFGSNR